MTNGIRVAIGLVLAAMAWHTVCADPGDQAAASSTPVARFSTVELSVAMQQAIGLKTETLKQTRYRATRPAFGEVVNLDALLQDYGDLTNASAQTTQKQAKLNASRAEYQRLQGLYQLQRNVSKKELQAAHASWLTDQAAANAAHRQESAVKARLKARWGPTLAQWMSQDNTSFEHLIDGKSRLLELTLPLDETPLSGPMQEVRVRVAAGTTIPVTFISAAPGTDPALQGSTYYFLATSAIDRLSYGLRVSALMPYGSPQLGVIVPDAAVVWSYGSAWVYIKTGTDRFEQRPVHTNQSVPGGWFEATGLRPGTTVVTHAAQILFSLQALGNAPKGSAGGEEDDDAD